MASGSPKYPSNNVTLATQSYGAGPAENLGPRCSLLLLHGADDQLLLPSSSSHIFTIAREPKEIQRYEGTKHNSNKAAEEVFTKIREWLIQQI